MLRAWLSNSRDGAVMVEALRFPSTYPAALISSLSDLVIARLHLPCFADQIGWSVAVNVRFLDNWCRCERFYDLFSIGVVCIKRHPCNVDLDESWQPASLPGIGLGPWFVLYKICALRSRSHPRCQSACSLF